MGKTEESSSEQNVRTPRFRVSFPHLLKPSAIRGSDPKYSVTMLFDKKQDLGVIKKALRAAKIAEFGDEKKWPKELHSPVQDGDSEEHADKKGYQGCWVVKASTGADYKPGVYNEDAEPVMSADEIYPGCYAIADVYARAWEFGNKKGVHFILDQVQKVADGERLGGRKSAKFSPVRREETNESEESQDSDSF